FRESGIGNRESGIGNRESGIGNRESGIGSSKKEIRGFFVEVFNPVITIYLVNLSLLSSYPEVRLVANLITGQTHHYGLGGFHHERLHQDTEQKVREK
ncbi:MAG: hypothetical protein F6J98_42195, partial [Moorea sp. SIO4G2]|nr:hypothetical protein [Moorena sp. SIO4G2]